MPRKKRRAFIIASIVILILIIISALVAMYIYTDAFKSSSTLFAKYIGKNVESIENLYNEIGKSEYIDSIKENKYISETEVTINYTENKNTTLENKDNSINQLKLQISGQTDNANNYDHKDINLLRANDEKIAEIRCIKNDNLYGIQFSDMFNQYLVAKNENLKELFETSEIPDSIKFENNFDSILKFLENEKENLKTKYSNIIAKNISKDNFSKQSNQTVQINENNINANAYILTLTKEQLNNIYIKMLEELKQDEIILSRIDKIQEMLEQYQTTDGEVSSLRNNFVENIEKQIEKINQNNIGQDEYKVIVYENKGKTIKTVITGSDYEITLNSLLSENSYIQLSYKDMENEEENRFTYNKNNEQTNITFEKITNDETITYDTLIKEEMNNNKYQRNIICGYEDNTNSVEMNIEQLMQTVNNFDDQVILNNENSINLNELEPEQKKIIFDKVGQEVLSKIEEITTTQININDLREVLLAIGFVQEQQLIEGNGVTETERNRFNSKFEMLQGENLESDRILSLINAVKDNLIELEVVSNTQLKLKLDRFNKNEEMATTLTTFIENNKSRKYNATIEYNNETGLISDILLTIIETER